MSIHDWFCRSVYIGLAGILIMGTSPARSQEVIVPVDVTVTGVAPPASQSSISVVDSGVSVGVSGFASGSVGLSVTGQRRDVCGGLGDPLETGITRFAELTQQRTRAGSQAERDRLDREIIAQGAKLPALVTEDFGRRNLVKGQSSECDELIDSVTSLMKQVADYLGALRDARTAILW